MLLLPIILAVGASSWSGTMQESAPAAQAAPPPKAVEPTDLDRLQGRWQCTAWRFNGRDDPERARGLESSYEGNRLTLWTDGREYRHGLVTLDPGRTVKAMNTSDLDGPAPDETNRGIYQLDGDTLKVCIVLDRGADRPAEFTSEPGSNRLLITYQRRKP